VDFKAAFDSINREALWVVLRQHGMPSKLVALFRALYSNTKCTVTVNGKDSAPFPENTGVRQGAIASPVLFNFTIDCVMHKVLEDCQAAGKSVRVSLGDYRVTDLQFFVDRIVHFGGMLGLLINPDKCKVLCVCLAPSKINVGGVELENVSSLITADTVSDKDILRRMSLSQASFQQLYSCLFSRADISIDTKMRVYLASVRTVLLYGNESWSSTSDFVSRLNSCEMGFMRRMLGATQIPYMSNDAVRLRCHVKESLSTIIKRRRLTWLGHTLRMNPERIPRQILTGR
jgi:hypothetical protein